MTYNGWANYDTWNVMLHIDNEEHLYKRKLEFFKDCAYKGITHPRYLSLIQFLNLLGSKTMDGVEYSNNDELDMMQLDDSVYGEFQEWKEYNA